MRNLLDKSSVAQSLDAAVSRGVCLSPNDKNLVQRRAARKCARIKLPCEDRLHDRTEFIGPQGRVYGRAGHDGGGNTVTSPRSGERENQRRAIYDPLIYLRKMSIDFLK
jgi:hypothetical protein